MKKVSLLFASVALSVCVSFAQSNVATVSESGTNQTATVGQTGILNVSHVTQSTKGNTANVEQSNLNLLYNTLSDINQSGEKNLATVKQIANGTLTGANAIGTLKAIVNQSGNKNEALQVQGPHNQQGISFAEIIQGGDKNFASQHQLKYGNEARINQAGSGNTAEQAQDSELLPDEEGSYGNALIEQSGNNNFASQKQDGWANEAKAYQSGSGNSSIQVQKDYSWKSVALVNQSGSLNMATQTQVGNTNSALIDQSSNSNEAIQDQKSGSQKTAGYAPLNKANIYQSEGTGNYAEQSQENLAGSLMVNEGVITQIGFGNDAYQTQWGGDNYSSVYQSGTGNMATVTQNMSVVQVNP
ncbi:MAG: hypothetical protein PHP53_08095 [Prolixibacteraceae bacterium]|nr:hypothetical protein [Prolixibacteraceae bacterium]